jgi:hypothetical protein
MSIFIDDFLYEIFRKMKNLENFQIILKKPEENILQKLVKLNKLKKVLSNVTKIVEL